MTHRNWHSIVGPNGMCECGVKADGTVINCADLLRETPAEPATAPANIGKQLDELLREAGMKVQFGLRQQGHFEKVERLRAEGANCARDWLVRRRR